MGNWHQLPETEKAEVLCLKMSQVTHWWSCSVLGFALHTDIFYLDLVLRISKTLIRTKTNNSHHLTLTFVLENAFFVLFNFLDIFFTDHFCGGRFCTDFCCYCKLHPRNNLQINTFSRFNINYCTIGPIFAWANFTPGIICSKGSGE